MPLRGPGPGGCYLAGPFACPCTLKSITLYSLLQAIASYQKGVVGTATEELLSLQEAADRLGVSVYTVRRWIKDGKLRAFKPGKEYRVREPDFEEFLRTREVRPKAPRRSPSEPSFNDVLEEQRRLSRVSEAIIAVAAKWGEAMSNPDMDDTKRSRLIEAALDLSGVLAERVEEEDWEAIPNQERLEIVTSMEKLGEAAKQGLRHAEESKEAREQEEQVNQRREQMREWTRQIA
jgi:excisionase family DNA binding protein